jgi:hypothetical protein
MDLMLTDKDPSLTDQPNSLAPPMYIYNRTECNCKRCHAKNAKKQED